MTVHCAITFPAARGPVEMTAIVKDKGFVVQATSVLGAHSKMESALAGQQKSGCAGAGGS
eukprot:3190319-Pyramimonas_sp.AAC.1